MTRSVLLLYFKHITSRRRFSAFFFKRNHTKRVKGKAPNAAMVLVLEKNYVHNCFKLIRALVSTFVLYCTTTVLIEFYYILPLSLNVCYVSLLKPNAYIYAEHQLLLFSNRFRCRLSCIFLRYTVRLYIFCCQCSNR